MTGEYWFDDFDHFVAYVRKVEQACGQKWFDDADLVRAWGRGEMVVVRDRVSRLARVYGPAGRDLEFRAGIVTAEFQTFFYSEPFCGVYALCNLDDPLYVGMSEHVQARCWESYKERCRFDALSVRFWRCETVEEAREFEEHLIWQFEPRFNRTGGKPWQRFGKVSLGQAVPVLETGSLLAALRATYLECASRGSDDPAGLAVMAAFEQLTPRQWSRVAAECRQRDIAV